MLTKEHQVQRVEGFGNNTDKHISTSPKHKHIDAFIIGCGTVGGALIEQIKAQQSSLSQDHDINLQVHGIANRSTFMLQQGGIDLTHWQTLLQNSKQQNGLSDLVQFITENQLHNPVIIDCTGSRQVAWQYQEYLAHGMHIITANKIANGEDLSYYQQIRQTAKQQNKRFLYETNIGAGLPVIEPLQKLLKSGDQLHRFEGILSGSLSYIFGELHNGLSLSEATLKARDLGYTEPDPREDLNGLDVARKVLIIAREAGMQINLSDIQVESVLPAAYEQIATTTEFLQRLPELDTAFTQRTAAAEQQGQVLRYVATLMDGQCKVSIESLPADNPLYGVKDGENVLAFYSQYYQPKPLVIKGYGAGPAVTAAGVFSDLLRVVD